MSVPLLADDKWPNLNFFDSFSHDSRLCQVQKWRGGWLNWNCWAAGLGGSILGRSLLYSARPGTE